LKRIGPVGLGMCHIVCLELKSPAAMNDSAVLVMVSRSEGSRGSCGGLYIELMVISVLAILILIDVD